MKCRHCSSSLHTTFLDLASAPPSNAYLSAAQLQAPELWYPLRVLVCETCWLVQTQDHAGRETLFTQDYAYFSSYAQSWLDHAQAYVHAMQKRFGLDHSSMVIEVAANDGYLLQYVQQAGIPCLGVEPTTATATAARAKGITIVQEFFGTAFAQELKRQGRSADLMVANNVLAHVPDINDFVAGFAALLKPQGVATFEFPHLLRMVQGCQFDTAYHEHYSYLSLTAVQRIFAHNGLCVFDVEHLSTHGGSLRVYAQRADSGSQIVQPSVTQCLREEQATGMHSRAFYENFAQEPQRIARGLLTFLLEQAQAGKSVAAYGAAAKGNTLLNFAGVRPHLLPYVVDRNPAKQGKFMPASHIPIVDEEHLHKHRPDYVLVLPWNLLDEVANQLAYVREWGARLVVAVPQIMVLEASQDV